MGAVSPIRVPSNTSNIKTVDDVVRFVSACISEMATQFNNLVSNGEVYGAIGATGAIGNTGSGFFGASFVTTGTYWVGFRVPFVLSPVVVATANTASTMANVVGVSTTGFQVKTAVGSTLTSSGFYFFAKGPRGR